MEWPKVYIWSRLVPFVKIDGSKVCPYILPLSTSLIGTHFKMAVGILSLGNLWVSLKTKKNTAPEFNQSWNWTQDYRILDLEGHNCSALHVAWALQKHVGCKSDSAIQSWLGPNQSPGKNCCTAGILRLVHHDTMVAHPPTSPGVSNPAPEGTTSCQV